MKENKKLISKTEKQLQDTQRVGLGSLQQTLKLSKTINKGKQLNIAQQHKVGATGDSRIPGAFIIAIGSDDLVQYTVHPVIGYNELGWCFTPTQMVETFLLQIQSNREYDRIIIEQFQKALVIQDPTMFSFKGKSFLVNGQEIELIKSNQQQSQEVKSYFSCLKQFMSDNPRQKQVSQGNPFDPRYQRYISGSQSKSSKEMEIMVWETIFTGIKDKLFDLDDNNVVKLIGSRPIKKTKQFQQQEQLDQSQMKDISQQGQYNINLIDNKNDSSKDTIQTNSMNLE